MPIVAPLIGSVLVAPTSEDPIAVLAGWNHHFVIELVEAPMMSKAPSSFQLQDSHPIAARSYHVSLDQNYLASIHGETAPSH
jgi:hypothetical protein